MDMIILTFIVAEPSNCTDFRSTPFMPFLPSLERLLRKHRLMQKPQMPRIMRAIKMKIATTPHVGMPVLPPIKSAASSDLSLTLFIIDSVGSGVDSSSAKNNFRFSFQSS